MLASSHYRNVSKQTTRCSGKISRIMRRTLCYSIAYSLVQLYGDSARVNFDIVVALSLFAASVVVTAELLDDLLLTLWVKKILYLEVGTLWIAFMDKDLDIDNDPILECWGTKGTTSTRKVLWVRECEWSHVGVLGEGFYGEGLGFMVVNRSDEYAKGDNQRIDWVDNHIAIKRERIRAIIIMEWFRK
ncbi:hypothetical protein Tco_0046649 [Tanacetum coccineum]